MNHKVMFELLSSYLDILQKKNKNQYFTDLLENIQNYKNKIISAQDEETNWITTGEVVRRYGVKKQNLHANRRLNRKRIHDRKMLWDDREVKEWRDNVKSKGIKRKGDKK